MFSILDITGGDGLLIFKFLPAVCSCQFQFAKNNFVKNSYQRFSLQCSSRKLASAVGRYFSYQVRFNSAINRFVCHTFLGDMQCSHLKFLRRLLRLTDVASESFCNILHRKLALGYHLQHLQYLQQQNGMIRDSFDALNLRLQYAIENIESLSRGYVSFGFANLVSTEITLQEVVVLADSLRFNATIHTLWLDHNVLGDEGAETLAEVLSINKTIQAISLRNCCIGDFGASSLSSSLWSNETLKMLSLCGNLICNTGAKSIASFLIAECKLTHLNLEYNRITDIGARDIAKALRIRPRSSEILSIHMAGNFVNSPVNAEVRAAMGM